MRTVVIAGVGLIGGSFALALRKAGFTGRILGVSSPRTIEAALARSVIDEGVTLEEGCRRADLLYLAQPISKIVGVLPLIDGFVRPGALVTDAGSTKAAIVRTAYVSIRRAQFLGGHPLAGKESRGVEVADADLFKGRAYVVTPGDLSTDAARTFIAWLERIGAVPLVMSPEAHDRTLALTSHLPQLASTALAVALADKLQHTRAAGPALLDSTRLALSPFDVWRDIIATNAENIEAALDAYIATLEDVRSRLRTGDLNTAFETAARFAAGLRS
jgi:prephenate dehydrogenase